MRRQNFQTVSWFWDLSTRSLLELDPPYQRRSVWNIDYKEYFIDTILMQYPAPAIFLYESLDTDGRATYSVVDGKQRLTAVFEFLQSSFPVGERAERTALRGLYFTQLSDEDKKKFWSYQFLVEYLPTTDENVINNIFDRINRNVAKLTAQELRHARFNGEFINTAEELTEWMQHRLPQGMPNFAPKSKMQMKDVEFTATLLLLFEEGPKSYSQAALDEAFSERELAWSGRYECEDRFKIAIQIISELAAHEGGDLGRSRLRNQADFYSLVGAVSALPSSNIPIIDEMARRLRIFVASVDREELRERHEEARVYYDAARSASNDAGPRTTRIQILKRVLVGELPWGEEAL
jgi:hypothetical protein